MDALFSYYLIKFLHFHFICYNFFLFLLSLLYLQIKHKSPNPFIDNIHKNEYVSNSSSILDILIYTINSDKESDDERTVGISSELLTMVEGKNKVLGPHQELVEVINLGSQKESKEVKIHTSLTSESRKKLINLLHE